MNKLLILAFVATSTFVFADTFAPSHTETKDFKIWAADDFRHLVGNDLQNCAVTTTLSDDGLAVNFKMGIQGSNFDVFGWDMNIPLADLPLKAGYTKDFVVIGSSSMTLSYDGKKLSWKLLKKNGLWSRIYPFELVIDPTLSKPTSLKASLSGYDTDILGSPKKHLTQECSFH